MNNTMAFNDFIKFISIWEKELDQYSLEDLHKKPDEASWSIGQVYNHLIKSTLGFHLKQAEQCLQSDEHASESKNFRGFLVYNVIKRFPPVKVKVPPSEHYTPGQPESR